MNRLQMTRGRGVNLTSSETIVEVCPLRRWSVLRRLVVFSVLTGSACTAGIPEPAGSPVPDPAAEAADLIRASTPVSPQQVVFRWVLNEAGTRLQGRGVARYEAAERLRLDLFGPRGETYLAAALVGDSLRVPPSVRGRIELPSPSLLWGTLAVIRPPTRAELVSASRTDEQVILRYSLPESQILEYRAGAAAGERPLQRVERLGTSGVLESIELSYGPEGRLDQARYRNWPAYRELIIEIEEIGNVASFPPETWLPDSANF